jgi:SAM-dependent methyltransferase
MIHSFIRQISTAYWIPRHNIEKFCREKQHLVSGRVLDFGCGSMPYAACFSGAQQYIGLEYDRDLVQGSHYVNGSIYFYNGSKLPFSDNQFDSIVCFQVIEHVEDLHSVLLELKRISRPNANILFTGPLLWPEHETPFDFRRYTRWGIAQVFELAGFEVSEIKPLGSVYDVVCVFVLDHLNTHRFIAARLFGRLICPCINLLSILLNKLDPWASRMNRYSYLDLGLVAIRSSRS